MTFQTVKCYINVGRQLDTNHIDQPARRRRPTGSNRLDIILTPDDTLGVKKTRGKLSVVTGVRMLTEMLCSARPPSGRE